MANTVQLTLDRVEGDQAILVFSDHTQITLPLSLMPIGTTEGSVVRLSIVKDADATFDQQEQARHLLNEVLKSN